MVQGNGGNRPGRGTTHRDGRKPSVAVDDADTAGTSSATTEGDPPALPVNALVVVAYDELVGDFLVKVGAEPASPVYVKHPASNELEAFNGFLVNEDVARMVCERCYPDLCKCGDKWEGPIVLGRVTVGRQARILHRTELPVKIPQAA